MEQEFRKSLNEVPRVLDFVASFFAERGIAKECLLSVQLAVEEVFVNMIRHEAAHEGRLVVGLSALDGLLEIQISNFGAEPFDLTLAAPPDLERPIHLRPVGGLGIHLVKSVMDDIKYHYADHISRVTLVKRVRS